MLDYDVEYEVMSCKYASWEKPCSVLSASSETPLSQAEIRQVSTTA